jgi:2-phosphosulfolactate phosphatase
MRQDGFTYRFDWGIDGLRNLAPVVDVVIVVDVLRFTTAVCAALESEGTVFPFPWANDGLDAYAVANNAVAAGLREQGRYSLSPTDLLTTATGSRIVLPSPNGAALAFAARDHGARRVLAGCLRNASATARFARANLQPAELGHHAIAVIAAGERWDTTQGPLRPAVEDLIGAGAILSALDPSAAVANPGCSPEAAAARAAFQYARPRLFEALCASGSGRELLGRGWEDDVATSAALDVTDVVAELIDNAFVKASR